MALDTAIPLEKITEDASLSRRRPSLSANVKLSARRTSQAAASGRTSSVLPSARWNNIASMLPPPLRAEEKLSISLTNAR
jgi:hypothetical protein